MSSPRVHFAFSSQSHRVVLAFNVLRSLAFFSRSPCSLFIFASQSHRVLLVCFFFSLLALFSRSPCSLRTFASQSHHVRVRFYLLSLHSLCAFLAFSRHLRKLTLCETECFPIYFYERDVCLFLCLDCILILFFVSPLFFIHREIQAA